MYCRLVGVILFEISILVNVSLYIQFRAPKGSCMMVKTRVWVCSADAYSTGILGY